MPVQIPNVQVAARDAVDGSPEEDVAGSALLVDLPGLGDKVGMLPQVVQDACVEDRLALELLAEFVALDGLALCLVRRQEEINLLAVEEEVVAVTGQLEVARFLMGFHLPTLGDERFLAVHDMVSDDHFHVAREETLDTFHAPQLVEHRLGCSEIDSCVLIGCRFRHCPTSFSS